MQVIVSHPTGNKNVRAVIESFFAEGLLSEFATTISINAASTYLKLLPLTLRTELQRRTFSIPSHKVSSYPVMEALRMTLPKIGLRKFTNSEHSFAGIDAVYRTLDHHVAQRLPALVEKSKISAVYAYEDGALETFKKAKSLGLKCIYDLPIAYWECGRRLMKAEAERLPEWACTLGGGINDSEEKLRRKTKELELADMVIAPGDFVINSLPNWTGNKLKHLAPFGSPEGMISDNLELKNKESNRPLRILFAGSMGQRKGLGDLFAAMKLLNNSNLELVVMGSLLAPMEFYRQQFSSFRHEGGRPHAQVLELMRSCDVFCLPSIVEGRALVMQEAMSQGLPIIITPNTGGEDLVIEGKTGFLVPISSPETIAEKLNWFLENRKSITDMGRAAKEHASKYTWDAYGRSIAGAIKSNLRF
ncbi:MAG TPA: glycosyltransferase family 4 protein [Pedobacter sp.]|jgi:glycosyltransferase involved in cell wall biosynthesis